MCDSNFLAKIRVFHRNNQIHDETFVQNFPGNKIPKAHGGKANQFVARKNLELGTVEGTLQDEIEIVGWSVFGEREIDAGPSLGYVW